MPPCPLHALTGLWCPFCGLTRAAWAVGHLRWRLAMDANPLAPAYLVGVIVFLWVLAGGPTPRVRLELLRAGRWLASAGVLGFAVARNLPALAVLAPHGHP